MRSLSFLPAAGLISIALAIVILVTAHLDFKFLGILTGGAGLLMFVVGNTARR